MIGTDMSNIYLEFLAKTEKQTKTTGELYRTYIARVDKVRQLDKAREIGKTSKSIQNLTKVVLEGVEVFDNDKAQVETDDSSGDSLQREPEEQQQDSGGTEESQQESDESAESSDGRTPEDESEPVERRERATGFRQSRRT